MMTLAGKGSLRQQETNIIKTEIVSTKDGKPKLTTTTRNLNPTVATIRNDITHQIDTTQVDTHQDMDHMNRSSLLGNTDVFMWIPIGRTILKNHHQEIERGHNTIGAISNNKVKARGIIIGTTDHTDLSNIADHLRTSITRTVRTLAIGTGDREAIQDKGKY